MRQGVGAYCFFPVIGNSAVDVSGDLRAVQNFKKCPKTYMMLYYFISTVDLLYKYLLGVDVKSYVRISLLPYPFYTAFFDQ